MMVNTRPLTQSRIEAVRRILDGAALGVPQITGVLAVTPTYSQSASATITANSVSVSDARITPLGGQLLLISAPQYRIQGTSGLSNRGNGHGAGISFGFYGQTLEVGANFNGVGFSVYFTDLITGQRLRGEANDYVDTTGYRFHKFDLGSAKYVGVEI